MAGCPLLLSPWPYWVLPSLAATSSPRPERVFFVREFRLIRIRKLRNLTLEDVWDLPSRFKLETVQREFAYDVNQRFFLIRAIVRMVWRPLLPLMALQTALQVVEVAKIMARARLLVCLGAPSSYPWYHVYGAVLCEFLVSVVCTQTERVNALVHGEIQRATNALSTELFCLLLMRNGQRRHRISKGYTHMVGSLVTGLMCFMPVVPRIVGFPAVFMALYSHVGRLAAIPVAAHIAVGISYRLCLRFLGTSDQWDADSRIPYDNRADEIYSGIRTIKLFGWERMHTDPNLLLQDVARNRLPWYASAVRALWHVLDAAMMMSDTASAYLMMSMHLGRHPPAASGQLSVGLITVYEHAQNMCMTAEYVSSSFSSLRETMRLMFDFERALRGEPLNTLPQHDGALPGDAPAVSMSGCSFILNQKAREPVLEDVSLDAKDGELVAVVGKTGSGKSSLLLAICGELEMTSGSGGVTGRIAYLEQQPWIMNDTLRANVLFGREYDQAFFEQVVHACALTDDLARWPDADLTVIGERGINISGGQRARLALARTLYSRADVYVLDDPLSAVDAHVKRHILDHVLLDTGMLAGKLRIVATNSNHILPYAHQVVALKDRRATNAVYVFRLCGWPVLTAILLSSLQFSMSDSASHELIGIRRESEIAHSRTSFIIADGERMARLSNGSVPPAALAAYQNLVVSFVRTISHVIDLPRDIYRLSNSIDIFRVYASIKPEAPYVVEGCRPQPSWPQAGRIEFRDFSLRYRADLPPALDGVSLAIKAGEKVGIVGRTGSGKSTLAKSLFRLVHGATSGSVLVDGQDISQMGIGDLRPRLGIIPQESTMFDGSYCKNLDPLREHTIEDMWAALIQSGIAAEMAPLRAAPGNDDADDEDNYDEDYEEAVAECNRRWAESGWAMRLLQLAFIKSPQKKPKKKRTVPLHGLHRTAQSNIRGFSSGQQQLFSLCRVLMRKRRVIVLDEATANVDLATDREMQRIIRSEFKDHTVLTIAHRLETIMDCDRIVVMDRGRIAEVGSPKNLIDAGGHFAELVKANDFGS
ncbi:ABC transporter C member 13 [Coemansia javaensis]|uniref:ABC transporter C member 13 n=1 Tax=Coemansia javaensis TaxID=2761396 RepID=A0A9W8HF85_9FUNG|nr:ABC transporter C member 13 [Coemansia javaensis]